MPLNVFDFESIQQVAERRANERMAQIRQKFFAPELAAGIGELMSKIRQDSGVYAHLRRQIPDQMKEMEVRYGKG